MERAWNWLLDKKTNTLRRWRSSNIRSSTSADQSRKSPARGKKDKATKLQKTMGDLPPDLLIDQLGVHSGGRSSSNMELARADFDLYDNGRASGGGDRGGGGRMQLLSASNAMKRTQSYADEGRRVNIPPSEELYVADEGSAGRFLLAPERSGDNANQQTDWPPPDDDPLLVEKRRSRVTFDLQPDGSGGEAATTLIDDDDRPDGAPDFERFFEQSQSAIEEALKERKNSTPSGRTSPSSTLLASARLSIDEEYPEGTPDSEWNRPLIEQVAAEGNTIHAGRPRRIEPSLGDRPMFSSMTLPSPPSAADELDTNELDGPTSSNNWHTSVENLSGQDEKWTAASAKRTHSLSVPDTGTSSSCSGRSPSSSPVDPRRQSLALRRQSNQQLVQKMSRRRGSTTTIIPLTAPQIHMVRTIWKQIYTSKGPTVLGSTIFHKLFFKSPGVKDAFRQAPIPAHHGNHDSFMKAHYKSLADIIDLVITNLENLDAVSPDLQEIGRIHAHVLDNGLPTKFWNLLAETFIDCTLEWGDRRSRTETVRKAWALIVAYIVEKIKNGHTEERRALTESGMVLGSEATYFRDTR